MAGIIFICVILALRVDWSSAMRIPYIINEFFERQKRDFTNFWLRDPLFLEEKDGHPIGFMGSEPSRAAKEPGGQG